MINRSLVLCLFWIGSGLASALTAGSLPDYGKTLPDSVWHIDENPEKDIRDAVIVNDYWQLNDIYVRRYRMIRILSERGKAAAELIDEEGLVRSIKGRVIDRDGTVVTFDKKEDFVEVLAYKTRYEKKKSLLLVPPGLTNDCVVELEWTYASDDGLPQGSQYHRYFVQEPFYALKKTIEIPVLRNRGEYLMTRYVWSSAAEPVKMTKIGGGKTRPTILTYENVPPAKWHPFGNAHYDPQMAFVLGFKTYPDTTKETEKFWKNFCRERVKSFMNEGKLGDDYRRWLSNAKSHMEFEGKRPKNMITAAQTLLERLHSRLACTRLMNAEQLAAYRATKKRDNDTLETCFERGWADTFEMSMIYFRALEDLKIDHRILFATQTDEAPFRPNERNPFVLAFGSPFFEVHDGQNTAVFCAWATEFPAGYLPTSFQGTRALAVNPADKWAHEQVGVPLFGPENNRLVRHFQMNLSQKRRLDVTMTRQGSGAHNALIKYRYWDLPEEERVHEARRRWRRRLGHDYEIDNLTIENNDTTKSIVKLTLQAHSQLDSEYSWLTFDPFPGTYLPFQNPTIWPKDRNQPILLDYPCELTDVAEITLPAGWALRGDPSWTKSNGIGSVSYVVQGSGQGVVVQRKIILKNSILGPQQERDLKIFLAWVEEAIFQTIAVAKEGVN
ncbi:hypothetical protein SCOR_01095 [Sulfidibacter corallicola]|uniref:DUF3857 domain-containing protein n=1 Tax=Sulfidibacter corallicola TaxID=2818388 RepID=A0A8A4TH90_SULCO|nr:hypothetical protein [Sulfidibacter corallicola]QTD48877.1 hypothetical protein J3U87_25115 [Sulfidibacter corallicola]